jgi:thiamine biosynthesis protein ThiS
VNEMTVVVNGETRTIAGPATVADLLAQLSLDPRMVVVELNREIIRRQRVGEVRLRDGDSIELVHFVGGG